MRSLLNAQNRAGSISLTERSLRRLLPTASTAPLVFARTPGLALGTILVYRTPFLNSISNNTIVSSLLLLYQRLLTISFNGRTFVVEHVDSVVKHIHIFKSVLLHLCIY